MSTYQYYEFQAIDRPLTAEEQQAVAHLSSRVEPHPRQAVFVYHWSGFPGNSREILARYYECHALHGQLGQPAAYVPLSCGCSRPR